MRATTGASAARLAVPAAFRVRSQPQEACAGSCGVRQRWTERLRRSSSGSGGAAAAGRRRTSSRYLCLAASGSGAGDARVEDLISPSYHLGAEERSWLETWRSLLAAPAADPAAFEAALSGCVQEFAALTPAQQWRTAWTQLDAAERYNLVHKYAARSEAELVRKAAADYLAQRDSGFDAPDLLIWLVLAAAHGRRSEEEAAAAAAGLQATAEAAADSSGGSSSSSSSRSSSSGSSSSSSGTAASEYTTEQVLAILKVGAASLGAIALMWLGWQRAAAAGWALPAAPWGGGTVVSVLAAYAVAWHLTTWLCAWLRTTGQRRHASTARGAAYANVLQTPHTTCVLVATAALLHTLVVARYPKTLSLGLFKASLWPLQAWLPAAAAFGALQACLVFLSSQIEAEARLSGGAVAVPIAQDHRVQQMVGVLTSRHSWAAWLWASAVAGPIHEELLFRGFLLPSLALWMPPGAAVALSSLMFALWHNDPVGIPALWWGGCVFGWSYAITGNLLAPVLLHCTWNLGFSALVHWRRRQHAPAPTAA